MDKRYQVFISSTFTDLIDERQSVLKAILELDHMPAGMELFPAADDSAWQLIKDVIDASDYYVLIIGGRYGSLDEAGLSYTEKEYDYALKKKKPVIPLLHENPDNLPRDKTDTDKNAWEKLKSFRCKVEDKHTCVYWNSAADLKAKVIVGLTSAVKRHPATGWVRADQVPSSATIADILKLRQRVTELEEELNERRTTPPPGSEDLLQGDEQFELKISFDARPPGGTYRDEISYEATINPSWNEIFAGIAPTLINETTENKLRVAFKKFLTRFSQSAFEEDDDLKDHRLSSFSFDETDIDTCIVQFRALGLIKESDRKRSVKDTATYWALTPYGDQLMVQLRALRRKPVVSRRRSGKAHKSTDKETT